MPVKVFVFHPDMANADVLRTYARLPDRCLVLYEDFDATFDGRAYAGGGAAKFTFDAVLNGIDGIFGAGAGVVHVVTANDLGRVDGALKARPGRCRHVLPSTASTAGRPTSSSTRRAGPTPPRCRNGKEIR